MAINLDSIFGDKSEQVEKPAVKIDVEKLRELKDRAEVLWDDICKLNAPTMAKNGGTSKWGELSDCCRWSCDTVTALIGAVDRFSK